ncbi:MAG TPA: hypothetical protein VHM23_02280 [Actinomycetota bacterium]|jgi:hypothetical protein|nr:hypothetical protein [Actinomycetota bacterium]
MAVVALERGDEGAGVGTGREQHVDAGREVLKEVAEGPVAPGVGHQVVVVQHQRQRRAVRAEARLDGA